MTTTTRRRCPKFERRRLHLIRPYNMHMMVSVVQYRVSQRAGVWGWRVAWRRCASRFRDVRSCSRTSKTSATSREATSNVTPSGGRQLIFDLILQDEANPSQRRFAFEVDVVKEMIESLPGLVPAFLPTGVEFRHQPITPRGSASPSMTY